MPRSLASLLFLLALTLAAPARAEDALGTAREAHQAARRELAALTQRQAERRAELDALTPRLESLKRARATPPVPRDGALEAALQRAQQLGAELAELAQQRARAEAHAEEAALALHAQLSRALDEARTAWDADPRRETRGKLLERMRALRAEREQVQSALPPARLPPEAPGTAADPEELLARADALRDAQDKVAARLTALRERIRERHEEAALDQRMDDFLADESRFDEQDRRLRLRREGTSGALRVDPAVPSGAPGPEAMGAGGVSADGSPPTSSAPGGATEQLRTGSPTAVDRRPQVQAGGAPALAGGAPDSLEALEAEAARLEAMARELGGRAEALERRAREAP